MIRAGIPAAKPAIAAAQPDTAPTDVARSASAAPTLRAGGDVQTSPVGTSWRPSAAPEGSGADWANAKRYFTFPSPEDWVARFDAAPDIWQNLLGDIYRETKAERERKAGKARIGRRPRAIDGSMDELWQMITPKYSVEPFAPALKSLMESNKVSMLALAKGARIPRTTLNDMVAGKLPLDCWRLEQIARFFDVSPSYFREFRENYVLTVIAELMSANPNLSIRFGRGLTGAAARAGSPVTRGVR